MFDRHELVDIDERSKASWNDTYVIDVAPVLWSEGPVPYVHEAAFLAATEKARFALDLPCGDGRNIAPLSQQAKVVVGADSSANAIARAAHIASAQGVHNCLLLQSNVFETGFAADQFDVVFCWDLLGHLVNVRGAITEMLRITVAGGHLIGSVFAESDSTRGIDMRRVGEDEYLYRDRFYYRFYTRAAVEDLLASTSADVVSLQLATWTEPPHEGFREYEHQHQSWAFILRKTEKERN